MIRVAGFYCAMSLVLGVGLFAGTMAAADRALRRVGIVLAALLMCGCPRPEVPRTDVDRVVAAASEHGWRAAGLPDPGSCLARLHVTWARDAAELAGLCGSAAMQCLLGSRVVLAPGSPPEYAIHEATLFARKRHNPHRCEAVTRDVYDHCHRDRRVWRDHPVDDPGGADSAQARAEEMHKSM